MREGRQSQQVAAFTMKIEGVVIKGGRQGCRVNQPRQVTNHAGVLLGPIDTIAAHDSFEADFRCEKNSLGLPLR